ncbi:MAG: hypothetical protein JWN34_658 [Bryobacterales bacterium]|nr:hypothetical protein [Bryobacterales bacterium]
MKVDAPERLAIKALDRYYDYTQAVQREDAEYRQAADYFREIERMAPGREKGEAPAKKKRA